MSHQPDWSNVPWLDDAIRTPNLRCTVEDAKQCLERQEFDAIALRGMSGALVAPSVALALDKNLIVVRKDASLGGREVEGDRACKRYIILDDFIDSGETVDVIATRVKKFAPFAECIGVYTYHNNPFRDLRPGFYSLARAMEHTKFSDKYSMSLMETKIYEVLADC